MIEKAAEARTGSWSFPDADLTIEFPLELLDEIRLTVGSSFHTIPKGGLEVGGLLFGTDREAVVRVAAWRPISCEHAKGSAFILSESDLRDLAHLMDARKSDPSLSGLEPVGWFLSHNRSDLTLTNDDIRIFNQCFPLRRQFTLVLRPDGIRTTKAAFFVRGRDGRISDVDSGKEFTVEPLRGARPHGLRSVPPGPVSFRRTFESRSEGEERIIAPQPVPLVPSSTTADSVSTPDAGRSVKPMPGWELVREPRGTKALVRVRTDPANGRRPHEAPRFVRERDRRRKSPWRWLWAVPIVALVVFAGLLAKERYLKDPAPRTLGLRVEDSAEAQLHINWDKQSPAVASAARGLLQINDAGTTRTAELDAPQIRQGNYTYARRGGDIKVKLTVYSADGAALDELARFVGPQPGETPGADSRKAWEKERADLEAQIKRLRADLAKETARSAQLQNTVRILENRLNISQQP